MAKFKCPYTYPHRSREAMIGYILSNGGYHRAPHDDWPLAYNVKAGSACLDFATLWDKYSKEHLPSGVAADPEMLDAYRTLSEQKYEQCKQYLWDWAQESAWSSVNDSDTYRMLWDGKDTIEGVEFGMAGRCGGYIVVAKFNHADFRRMSRSVFEDWLRDRDSVYAKDLRLLYKMCRQWETDFTQKNAAEEIENQAAWSLFANQVEPEWDVVHSHVLAARKASLGPKLGQRRISIRRPA